MNYEPIIDALIAREGGFVDHPADRGGATRYGITEAVARKNGYVGPMQELPESFARAVYRKRYIVEPRFDMVASVDPDIAAELIDTGVNCGPSVASVFLQRCLNVFNQQGSRYADLFIDGRIGSVTVDALRAYCRWRGADGVKVMVKTLNNLQAVRYIELAENDPAQESFVYGQIANRT